MIKYDCYVCTMYNCKTGVCEGYDSGHSDLNGDSCKYIVRLVLVMIVVILMVIVECTLYIVRLV